MSKGKDYFEKQCVLKKVTDFGSIELVSWIPEKLAKIGKFVKLKNEGKWEDGWKVIEVGARLSREDVEILEDAHRRHRDQTDV
jgi:hypothetical protein